MSTTFSSTNPVDGRRLATYKAHSDSHVEQLLTASREAFREQAEMSFAERSERMNKLAGLLDERVGDLAALMTAEMGKPIDQSRAEVEKCAWVCRYYAENAEEQLADELIHTEARRSLVAYQPIGAVLAIMPWNFPLWQVFRFAAPNVMAGNVGILKHASNVLGCGEAIAELFAEAGFANGVFQHLITDHDTLERVIGDDRVAAVTLTGSEGAGRAVAAIAGRHLKKTVLELGGTDAFIVLGDANLDLAVEKAVTSRVQNNGQSCIAAKRFIVERSVAEVFTARFARRMQDLVVGDPTDEDTDIGPLARKDLRDELHAQVRKTMSEGARLLTGGSVPDGPGNFYPPTVLSDVRPGMLPYREELFGPVASLTVVGDADAAIAAANAPRLGLGGAVFTEDRALGERVARSLECGCAFVNEMVKSHPHLPFGGVKDSGYGRELGRAGILEFVNAQTVWVD